MSKEYYMKLASSGAITEAQLMQSMQAMYRSNPRNFTMEEVDYLEKYNEQVNQAFNRNMEAEDGKILEGVNQFISGVVEGFTTLGWADETDKQGHALANKIGHFIGFAPDIIAGVVTGGLSASLTAAKLGGKLGTKHMSKSAKKKLGSSIAKQQARNDNLQDKIGQIQQTAGAWGKEKIPFLVTEGEGGSLALRSVPMRAADYLLGQSKAKAGAMGINAAKYFGKHGEIASDILIDKGVHLGLALGVSSIWEGPKAASEAAVHGTIAGIVFGGVGNYMNFGKMLSSSNSLVRKNGETLLRDKAAKISREGGQALDFLVKGTAGASYTGFMAKDAPLPDQVYELMLGFFFGASSRPWAEIQRTKLVNQHSKEIFEEMTPYIAIDKATGKPVWNESTGKRELTPIEIEELKTLSKPGVELDKFQEKKLDDLRNKQFEFDKKNKENEDIIGVIPVDITTFDFYKEAHPQVQAELKKFEGRVLQQVYERNMEPWDILLKKLYEKSEESVEIKEKLTEIDFSAQLIKIRNDIMAERKRTNLEEQIEGTVLTSGELSQTVDKDGNVEFSYIPGGPKWKRPAIEEAKDTLFVYADNVKGDTVSEASTEARGLDNSTFIRANNSKTEQWTDKTFKENKKSIDEDITLIEQKMKKGNFDMIAIMDVPINIATNAPKTAKYLAKKLGTLRKTHGFKGIKVYSGGATGADSIFNNILAKYNIKVTHYYGEGGKKPIKGNTEISKDELRAADEHISKANDTLDRDISKLSDYSLNLLRRNWFQIKDVDQVIAIGQIEKNVVDGGTAWAVQMAIDAGGKEVLVYDVIAKRWNRWDADRGIFKPTDSIPTLAKSYAAIGSRKVGQEYVGKTKLTESWKAAEGAIEELITYNYGDSRNPYPELTDTIVTSRKIKNNPNRINDDDSVRTGRAEFDEEPGEEFSTRDGNTDIEEHLQYNAPEIKTQIIKKLKKEAWNAESKQEFLDKVTPILKDMGVVADLESALSKYYNFHGNSMTEPTMAIAITVVEQKPNKKGKVYPKWDAVDIIATPTTDRQGKSLLENRPESITNLAYGRKVAFYIDYIDQQGQKSYYTKDFDDLNFGNRGSDYHLGFTPWNIQKINDVLRNKEWISKAFPEEVYTLKSGEEVNTVPGAYIFTLPKDKKTMEIRRIPWQTVTSKLPNHIPKSLINSIRQSLMDTYRANGGRVLTASPFFNNVITDMGGKTQGIQKDRRFPKQNRQSFFAENKRALEWGNAENKKRLEEQIMSNMIYELQEHGFLNKDLSKVNRDMYAEALDAYYELPPITNIQQWNKYRALYRGNGRQLSNEEVFKALGKDTLRAIAVEDIEISDIEFLAERLKVSEGEVESYISNIANTDGAIGASHKLMKYIGKDTETPGRSSVKPVIVKYGEVDGIGLILGKAGMFSVSKELNTWMESKGYDLIIRKSALKGDARVDIGRLKTEQDKDNPSEYIYGEEIEAQPFDLNPSDIRIIDSEIEMSQERGTKNIRSHKGVWNKINNKFGEPFQEAWNRLIDKQLNPDPDFDSAVDPKSYVSRPEQSLIDGTIKSNPNKITSDTIDRLSTHKIQEVVNKHADTELMIDIVKAIMGYSGRKTNLSDIFEKAQDQTHNLQERKIMQDVLKQLDYNPIYMSRADVAPYIETTIKNYLFARFQRPIVERGFDYTRSHSAEEIFINKNPELFKDGSNDKFFLNEGHRTDEIIVRQTDGSTKYMELGRAFDLYNGTALDKNGNVVKIGKKAKELLYQDLHYVITRAPQAGNSGMQSLLFSGFTGVEGRGYISNAKTYRDLNGMDVDIDAVSGYQSLEWAIKEGFKNPEVANELVGKKMMDLDVYNTGKEANSLKLKEILAQNLGLIDGEVNGSLLNFYFKSNPKYVDIDKAAVSTIFHPWWRMEQGKESQIGKDNIGIVTDNLTYFSQLATSIEQYGPKKYDLLSGSKETEGYEIDLRKTFDSPTLSSDRYAPYVSSYVGKHKLNITDFLTEAMHSGIASSVDGSKNWINRPAGGFIDEVFNTAFVIRDIKTGKEQEFEPGWTIPESFSSLMGGKDGKVQKDYIFTSEKDSGGTPVRASSRKVDENGRPEKQRAEYGKYVEPYNMNNASDKAEATKIIQEIVREPAMNRANILNKVGFKEEILETQVEGMLSDLEAYYNPIEAVTPLEVTDVVKTKTVKGTQAVETKGFPIEGKTIPNNRELFILGFDLNQVEFGYLATNLPEKPMLVFKTNLENITSISTGVDPMNTLRSMRAMNGSMSQKRNKKDHTAASMNWNAKDYLDSFKDHSGGLSKTWSTKQAEIVDGHGRDGLDVNIDLLKSVEKTSDQQLTDVLDVYEAIVKNNPWYVELIERGWFKEDPLLAGIVQDKVLTEQGYDATKFRDRKDMLKKIYSSDVLSDKQLFKSITNLTHHVNSIRQQLIVIDMVNKVLSDAGLSSELIKDKIGEVIEIAWELKTKDQLKRNIGIKSGDTDVKDSRLNKLVFNYKEGVLDNYYFNAAGEKVVDKSLGMMTLSIYDKGLETVESYDNTLGSNEPVKEKTVARHKVIEQEFLDNPDIYNALEQLFDFSMLSSHIGGDIHRNKLNHSLTYEYLHKDLVKDKDGNLTPQSEYKRKQRELSLRKQVKLTDSKEFIVSQKELNFIDIPYHEMIQKRIEELSGVDKKYGTESLAAYKSMISGKNQNLIKAVQKWEDITTIRGGKLIERLSSINPSNLKLFYDNSYKFWKELNSKNLMDEMLVNLGDVGQNPNNPVSSYVLNQQLKNKFKEENSRKNPLEKEDPILLSKAVKIKDVKEDNINLRSKDGEFQVAAKLYQNKETGKNEIYFSSAAISESFKKKSWKNPKVSGVKPIPIDFTSESQFKEFVVYHELSHFLHPQKLTEKTSVYENRMNRIALKSLFQNKLNKKQLEVLESENFLDWRTNNVKDFNILSVNEKGLISLEYDKAQNTSNAETLIRIREIELKETVLDNIILKSIEKKIKKKTYIKNDMTNEALDALSERYSQRSLDDEVFEPPKNTEDWAKTLDEPGPSIKEVQKMVENYEGPLEKGPTEEVQIKEKIEKNVVEIEKVLKVPTKKLESKTLNEAIEKLIETKHEHSRLEPKEVTSSKKEGFEVSTAGDKLGKQFSALNATLKDGRTVELAYQQAKGYKTIGEGKGKEALNPEFDYYGTYKELWNRWAKENPKKIKELSDYLLDNNITSLKDSKNFKNTPNNQAKALSEIITTFRRKQRIDSDRKMMNTMNNLKREIQKKSDEKIIDEPALKEPKVVEKEVIIPKESIKVELEEEVIKPADVPLIGDPITERGNVKKLIAKLTKMQKTKEQEDLLNEIMDIFRKKSKDNTIDIDQEDILALSDFFSNQKSKELNEGHSMKLFDVTPQNLEKFVDMGKDLNDFSYAKNKFIEEMKESGDLLDNMAPSVKSSVLKELEPMQKVLTLDDVQKEAGKHNIDIDSPDYMTPLMKARMEELVDVLTSDPRLVQDFQHEFTAVSAALGTQGKVLLGKAFENMNVNDMKWFTRYLKDAYDPSIGLIEKIKLYANIVNKNFNDADLGMESAEEALKKFKGIKGIYHIMFTRTIGESILKRHELLRFQERNVAVAKEGPDGAPALKSIIKPTSTLELIRDYVDFGKTNNTAATAMFKELYSSSFDFLQTQDKHLAKELESIFENAVRLREFKNIEEKTDGVSAEGSSWYTIQKEFADIYFKSLEGQKFEIKDTDSKEGKTIDKSALEIAEIINERLTTYLKEISDTFITKGMEKVMDAMGEKVVGYRLTNAFMGDMIRNDGWLSRQSMQNFLSKQKLQAGSSMHEQLLKAPGINQLNFLQHHYNILVQAESLFGKNFKTNPKAIDWRENINDTRPPKVVELIEDAAGLPSFFFPHNGMWDISGNQQEVSKALKRNLRNYEKGLEDGTVGLPQSIQEMFTRKAPGFETVEKAIAKAVSQKERNYTQSRMFGQTTDGSLDTTTFQNIAYSKSKGEIGQYISGSLNSRGEDFLPYYRIDKRAVDVYTNNTVKNYFDNLIGLKSQMLLDAFEKKNALGEHTENWSSFMRDSLINMLGFNSFREIGIAGITLKEHSFLVDIVKNDELPTDDVVRKVLGRMPGVAEKRFLQQLDDYVAPNMDWIKQQDRSMTGKQLQKLIEEFKMDGMKELADPKNINKIKRYGTVYNFFSEEGITNKIENLEEKLGAKFFKGRLSRIDHEGNRVDMEGAERRNMLGNMAKNFSNLEGKFQLLSLLAHPKTLITNIYGGNQNTLADNGWEIFRQATNSKFLIDKIFNNSEFKHKDPITGKIKSLKIDSKENLDKWVDSLGILDSMFLQEVGINKDLNKRDSSAFWKEFWKRMTTKLEKEPNKENQQVYNRLHKATLMELAREKGIADNIVNKGASFMQWSERHLRRTSFLASYLQARRNLHPLTKDLPFDSPVLIQHAKKGVEASQFMYHSAFRTNYSNTALGRVMTRFHPYAWNSISRRLKIYKGAEYVAWAEGVNATQKAQRQLTADLMAFALGTVFTSSIFEYALSPPMNWMQDSAQLLFGDEKTRERAFFSQWPHPVLAPLTVVTPPVMRFVLQPVNALLSDDLNSMASYSFATWLPFGRLGRDIYRTAQSPAMAPDFLTGIPLHRMHSKRQAYLDSFKDENAENVEE